MITHKDNTLIRRGRLRLAAGDPQAPSATSAKCRAHSWLLLRRG